jgi:hypothetical protein
MCDVAHCANVPLLVVVTMFGREFAPDTLPDPHSGALRAPFFLSGFVENGRWRWQVQAPSADLLSKRPAHLPAGWSIPAKRQAVSLAGAPDCPAREAFRFQASAFG